MQIGIIGCGWLGAPLAIALHENGHSIHGTSRDEAKMASLQASGINMHYLELLDDQLKLDWLKGLDLLIMNVPPSHVKSAYAEKHVAICEALPPAAKVIFISSTSVYADDLSIANENSPANQQEGNAPFIIETENKLGHLLGNQLTIIRFAGLVGKNRHPVKYMSGKSYCSGNSPVNLIHLEDCIGIINQVINEDCFGEVFNGCCSSHPTKADYYTAAAEALKIAPPTFTDSPRMSKIIGARKLRDVLNYQLKYPSPFDFPEINNATVKG